MHMLRNGLVRRPEVGDGEKRLVRWAKTVPKDTA